MTRFSPSFEWLERVYGEYNKRSLADPDPIIFLYDYPDPRDREIVALVAASLAYGRVAQILKSVEKILTTLSPSPKEFLSSATPDEIRNSLAGFKHRFTTGMDVADLLIGAKNAVDGFGSLENAFLDGYDQNDDNVVPALTAFAEKLAPAKSAERSFPLFPTPAKGGACKRPMLFLRWLVREDEVDPGGWNGVSTSKLLVPLDTHMRTIAETLGLTSRKSADLKTALEITAAFAEFNPNDPVKYDFALTRFGIRDDMDMKRLFRI